MSYGFGRPEAGYASFATIRGAFVRWLKKGGRDHFVDVVPDGKGPHSTQWLLAVISHSDEALTEGERRAFEEWLGSVDPYMWSWVTNLPRSTVLTFRAAARLIDHACRSHHPAWYGQPREC